MSSYPDLRVRLIISLKVLKIKHTEVLCILTSFWVLVHLKPGWNTKNELQKARAGLIIEWPLLWQYHGAVTAILTPWMVVSQIFLMEPIIGQPLFSLRNNGPEISNLPKGWMTTRPVMIIMPTLGKKMKIGHPLGNWVAFGCRPALGAESKVLKHCFFNCFN